MTADPTQSAHGRLALAEAPCDVEHVRELRVAIRRMKNSLPLNGPSRYNSMVTTSLEKAAMWLGDILACLGEAYPYPENTPVPVADDTDETYATHNPEWEDLKASLKLQQVRAMLGQMTKQLTTWIVTPVALPYSGPEAAHKNHMWQFKYGAALQAAYNHLREARLDLGMELGEALRQEAK